MINNIIDLKNIQKIIGANSHDRTGFFVNKAGDFNGDGIDDIIIGAPFASPYDRYKAGVSYILFGHQGCQISCDLSSSDFNGFKIFGNADLDKSGRAVNTVGDFNGDDIDDIIIGAPNASPFNKTFAGEAYVIFGEKKNTYTSIDLADNLGNKGFKIFGESENSYTAIAVGSAGDFNGDGINDIMLSAPLTSPLGRSEAGTVYILFGYKNNKFLDIDLVNLEPKDGFKVFGALSLDITGASISRIPDLNGDGINEIIIGSSWASPLNRSHAGAATILFGRKGNIQPNIDLADIRPEDGFKIYGGFPNGQAGACVNDAGDFNGDGHPDYLISAYYASPFGRTEAGVTFLLLGREDKVFPDIDLANLKPQEGFKIIGVGKGDQSGFSVSNVNDVNGDGLDDIIVGAYFASPSKVRAKAGESYVIFGRKGNAQSDIDLSNLNIGEGYKIIGAEEDDNSGYAVSSAGDFNKDGKPDIIIGAWEACPNNKKFSGAVYLLLSGECNSIENSIKDEL